jgi:hypothetical protein
MSKKTVKKVTASSAPKETVKRTEKVYPAAGQELDSQHRRVSQAAAAAAEAAKPLAKPPPHARTTSPAAARPAPEGSRPGSAKPQGEALPAAKPASQPQKTPQTTPARQPSATTTPSSQALEPDRNLPRGEKETISSPVPTSTRPAPAGVRFNFVKPGAQQVAVCGEFNGWSSTATPMKRHSDGHWETTLTLSPGTYQYKFFVDGEWLPDPAAEKTVGNSYGSLNSVLEVGT